MCVYHIRRCAGAPDWAAIPRAEIDCFCWKEQYPYQPYSTAQVCLADGDRLAVRLCSYEENPVSVCRLPDGPVHRDSCLEFFFNPYPEDTDCYLNFECNHAGCLFIGYGPRPGAGERRPAACLGLAHPPVTAFGGEDARGVYWGVSYEIPLRFLLALYRRRGLRAGHAMRGNFYKCGDGTPRPHFGSWRPIRSEKPNFHLPEYFGTLIVD